MRKSIQAILVLMIVPAVMLYAQSDFEKDVLKTSAGDLAITFVGHGTLMMEFQGKTIHIDPWTRAADYASMPKADLALITHHHGDHLDGKAVKQIRREKTVIVITAACANDVEGGMILKNGESTEAMGVSVTAVPAYNLVHKRSNGQPFHPKGEGNGYVLGFGDTKVYVAGDTENTPEMKALRDIDIAFLPMNLPYTMTPEMAADAVMAFRPTIFYPYHYGDTDVSKLIDLLKDAKGVEVRVRNMK
jgi:L-ascorbate metabolism protein UlaG (beta-lactamase superfamily)